MNEPYGERLRKYIYAVRSGHPAYTLRQSTNAVKLFVDQSNTPMPIDNSLRIDGMQLTYQKTPSDPHHYIFELEPAGDVHEFTQLLQSYGLKTHAEASSEFPGHIQRRMKIKAKECWDQANVDHDVQGNEKSYSHLVIPYLEPSPGKRIYGKEVLALLQEHGFLSESTESAMDLAIKTFDKSPSPAQVVTKPLRRQLTGSFQSAEFYLSDVVSRS